MESLNNMLNQILSQQEYKPAIPGVMLTNKYIQRTKNFTNENNDETLNHDCSICLESMMTKKKNTTTTRIGVLKCKHSFHYQCINRWIRTSAICPLCRATIKKW